MYPQGCWRMRLAKRQVSACSVVGTVVSAGVQFVVWPLAQELTLRIASFIKSTYVGVENGIPYLHNEEIIFPPKVRQGLLGAMCSFASCFEHLAAWRGMGGNGTSGKLPR